jgi:hypothetical protein
VTRDVPTQVPVTDRQSRYLYFDYAKDSIDRSQSASELSALAQNLNDGFQVTNIAGFTSPEGPMPPGRGRFIGNTALAQARADAAKQQVETLCPPTASPCIAGGANVAGSPDPELYTRVTVDDSGQVVEVEGAPLADAAVGDFLVAPAEERHRTPELVEQIGRQRTPAGRAGLVYPLLRRAVISLVRHRVEPGTRQETRTETNPANCPDDVVERAFGGASGSGGSGTRGRTP